MLILFVLFFFCVGIVVTFSIKLSNCADWFEQNTKISGALVGFFLAAATSLPELVSGITSVLLNQEELAIASILGSNLFNYNIVATANLAFISYYAFNKLSKHTNNIMYFVLSIYLVLVFTILITTNFNFAILNRISIASIIIIIIYSYSVKSLDDESEEKNSSAPPSLIKKTLFKSIIYALILIVFSSLLAKSVELLMLEFDLDASLAGSILLGASTSLPEFVSAITLMRKKQYDIAISSVVSSNLFNFFVLGILDGVSKYPINTYFTFSTYILITLGIINTLVIIIAIKFYNTSNRYLYALPSIFILVIYSFYLIFT